MQLRELLESYKTLDNQLTIYAEANPAWTCDSKAVLWPNSNETTQPIKVGGRRMEYMLEAGLAKKVIKVWSAWRGGRKPTPEEMCQAVIYYATHDAYLADDGVN